MKGCEVSKDTVIGNACGRIPGTGSAFCYLLSEVRGEDRETVKDLKPTVERALGCPFRQDALGIIEGKIQQPGEGFFNTMKGMPQTTRELVAELRRLNDGLDRFNDNLEVLVPMVPEFLKTADELIDVVRDLRTMGAHLLGWKVVRERE